MRGSRRRRRRAPHPAWRATAIRFTCSTTCARSELAWPTFDASAVEDNGDGSSVRAPIIGRVAKVFVKKGDAVAKGDRIAVVEAMKMEHVLHAARASNVARSRVAENQQVTLGALIAALE